MADTVFDPQILQWLATKHRPTFQNLGYIQARLNARFADMHQPILALIMAVASGESLLYVGQPGTAKSRLIRAFCEYIGIDPDDSGRQDNGYFEYLLTPFTEPSELFGYYNIVEAENSRRLVRDSAGMMQHARVVYLDEVFNGSSAILNSILAFMNERVFHDRGQRVNVKMQCMFGATNAVPYTNELRAIFDRFLLRCEINNVPAELGKVGHLLHIGWQETFGRPENGLVSRGNGGGERMFPALLDDLKTLQNDIRMATRSGMRMGSTPGATVVKLIPDESATFYRTLVMRVHNCRQYDYSEMSNRRLIKLLHVMLIHALYIAAKPDGTQPIGPIVLDEPQQQLLRFAVDRWDDEVFEILKLADVV